MSNQNLQYQDVSTDITNKYHAQSSSGFHHAKKGALNEGVEPSMCETKAILSSDFFPQAANLGKIEMKRSPFFIQVLSHLPRKKYHFCSAIYFQGGVPEMTPYLKPVIDFPRPIILSIHVRFRGCTFSWYLHIGDLASEVFVEFVFHPHWPQPKERPLENTKRAAYGTARGNREKNTGWRWIVMIVWWGGEV